MLRPIIFVLGILSWPVLEYILHRFLGHVLKNKTLFKKEHTRHHVETNYFAPKKYKIFATIPISLVALAISSLIFSSWSLGAFYTIGFLIMYCTYEYVHWSFHAKAPKTKLGLRLRKHHFIHHFHNPKMNHGVTSTIIDRIFGTYLESQVVNVPRKVALPWLLSDDKQILRDEFSKDFKLL